MPKTYAQIQKQIEALTREAEQLKRQEVAGVIARIKEAMAVYGLTPADLAGSSGRGRKAAVAVKRGRKAGAARKPKSAGVVKFRDESGNVWSGRGPRPIWLREALKAGRQLQEFAV